MVRAEAKYGQARALARTTTARSGPTPSRAGATAVAGAHSGGSRQPSVQRFFPWSLSRPVQRSRRAEKGAARPRGTPEGVRPRCSGSAES